MNKLKRIGKVLIKNDEVSIFHWNYENMSYTIQFAIYRNGKYYIDEMKAKYNQDLTDLKYQTFL